MNQILVSEKIYVTPELKRKKKLYKFDFFLSIFLVCILFSYYIYAEYDRNKNEEFSKEILSQINFDELAYQENIEVPDDSTIKVQDNAIVVILNEEPQEVETEQQEINLEELINPPQEVAQPQLTTASDGTKYYTIGIINIPKINVNYPILSTYSDALLKIAPCKFHGADPNQVGNLCIVAHNYRNSKFFSKVPTLENGDIIEITDILGKTLQYSVYDKFVVDPSDRSCTTQYTNGNTEITLITCTNDNKARVIVKARVI